MVKNLAERITAHWWMDTDLTKVDVSRPYRRWAWNVEDLSDMLKTSIFHEIEDTMLDENDGLL